MLTAYRAWGMPARLIQTELKKRGFTMCVSDISKKTKLIPKGKPTNIYLGITQCQACKLFFVQGKSQVEISKELKSSESTVNSVFKKWFPQANFTAIMAYRKSVAAKLMTKEIAEEAKKLHVVLGFGRKEIAKRLGIGHMEKWLRKQEWYDPDRGSTSNTIEMSRISDWYAWTECIKKRQPKKKRSRAVSDLPLFAFAAKQTAKRSDLTPEKRQQIRDREMQKYHGDPLFWIKSNMRKRLNKFVSGKQKVRGFENYCGCTLDELRQWIESQFEDWMTWENKGTHWHVDHIIPCTAFDLLSRDHQRICFNWRNLRPMSAVENISKGNSMDAAIHAVRNHPDESVKKWLLDHALPITDAKRIA